MNVECIRENAVWPESQPFNEVLHFVVTPKDLNADIEDQTRQALEQTAAYLNSDKRDVSSILAVNIYLSNFKHISTVNALWNAWLPEYCKPSRAFLKAKMAHPDCLIEVGFTLLD